MAKRGVPDHPKTLKLARRLGIAPWAVVGLMECFWHWCARFAMDGVIKSDPEDIADGIRYAGDPEELWAQLIACGWVDELEDGRFVVHDASEHADNTWKANLKRTGGHFWNEDVPDVEASSQPAQEAKATKTQPHGERVVILSPPSCDPPNQSQSQSLIPPTPRRGKRDIPDEIKTEFLRFKEAYPKRAGSQEWPEAMSRFAARRLDDRVACAALVEGARRYGVYLAATGKLGTEFVKSAASFLSPKYRFWEEPWSPPGRVGGASLSVDEVFQRRAG